MMGLFTSCGGGADPVVPSRLGQSQDSGSGSSTNQESVGSVGDSDQSDFGSDSDSDNESSDVDEGDASSLKIFLNTGSSELFEDSVVFNQLGNDIDGEAEDDLSGQSVALSEDGSILAIGAYGNDGNGDGSGYVSLYLLKKKLH